MQRDQAHRTNELLERIAIALEKNNKKETETTKDIPGFEGTKDALDNLCNVSTKDKDYGDDVHNDYLNDLIQDMNHIEYLNFHHDMAFGFASSDAAALTQHIYELEYEECLGAIQRAFLVTGDSDYVSAVASTGGIAPDWAGRKYVKELIEKENTTQPTSDNPDPMYNNLNEYVDTTNGKIKNDSDHDIRSTAAYYEKQIGKWKDIKTKKDAILDYVTNEFGSHGARYTDIIKFAYYLGCSNAPKYDSNNRGYYAMAFSTRYGGHLIQGGKDFLVKGINKEGKERYFAHSNVDSFTDYYKRIS